jgi:hypothetical protein
MNTWRRVSGLAAIADCERHASESHIRESINEKRTCGDFNRFAATVEPSGIPDKCNMLHARFPRMQNLTALPAALLIRTISSSSQRLVPTTQRDTLVADRTSRVEHRRIQEPALTALALSAIRQRRASTALAVAKRRGRFSGTRR